MRATIPLDAVHGEARLLIGGELGEAGRGQGRSHAVRLVPEGADLVAVDICEQIGVRTYPPATEADLVGTAGAVEKLDRRIVPHQIDVRGRHQRQEAVHAGQQIRVDKARC